MTRNYAGYDSPFRVYLAEGYVYIFRTLPSGQNQYAMLGKNIVSWHDCAEGSELKDVDYFATEHIARLWAHS